MSLTKTPSDLQNHVPLGSGLLFIGALLFLLCCIEATTGLPFQMPRSWYANQEVWWFCSVAMFIAGAVLLQRSTGEAERSKWRPSRGGSRFRHLVLYTRRDCGLCEEARAVLEKHRAWLPEITEIDIDTDPRLVEKYTTCVPVISFDGKVRFKGRVDEVLLRRLIEGTPPAERW